MKKILAFTLLLLFLSTTGACSQTATYVPDHSDTPFVITMKNDTLKILQLTDLHLTYGIDAFDRKTLSGIKTLVKSDDFDLVVITGDMMMSISAPALFAKLVRFMDGLGTPWTFVFGNHEADYDSYSRLLDKIRDTDNLYFKEGPLFPDSEALGVENHGNFMIEFTKEGIPFYKIYLMDSHAERAADTPGEGDYDYVRTDQVGWYAEHANEDTVASVMFMHIPLVQFSDPVTYEGIFDEDMVYAQGLDTGLFAAIVAAGRTKGVFVGHDHLNNFSLVLDGVLLAYGEVTGYNAYGDLSRGGRVIEVSPEGEITSYILLEAKVTP